MTCPPVCSASCCQPSGKWPQLSVRLSFGGIQLHQCWPEPEEQPLLALPWPACQHGKLYKEAKSCLLSFVGEQPTSGLAERNQSSLFAYQAVTGADRANQSWNDFIQLLPRTLSVHLSLCLVCCVACACMQGTWHWLQGLVAVASLP